jgi:hypothetical protein
MTFLAVLDGFADLLKVFILLVLLALSLYALFMFGEEVYERITSRPRVGISQREYVAGRRSA